MPANSALPCRGISPATGDEAQVLAKHEGLIHRVCAQYIPSNSPEFEDFLQEGRHAFLEAAGDYDPTRGTALSTFAWHRIRGRCLTLVRALRLQSCCVPLYDAVDTELGTPFPESLVESSLTAARLHVELANLPGRQAAAIRLVMLDDFRQTDAAGILGISKQRVGVLIRQGIASLQRALKIV